MKRLVAVFYADGSLFRALYPLGVTNKFRGELTPARALGKLINRVEALPW